MRILVTGGAGFLGKATVEAGLAAGHDMVVFDRATGGDITQKPDINSAIWDRETLVDHVIHLAGVLGTAELFDDPHWAVDVNVHGTLNVLEACTRFGVGYTAVTMPPVFPSVYTATKVCADRLATAWHHAHGLRTSHVVAYNAYGPGQKHGPGHPQKIIPTFATKAWAGEPIPIWGDGEQGVDLVHVDDIGRMLVDATAYGDDEVFDAGTGHMRTVNEIANFVCNVVAEETGRESVPHEYLPMRKGETPTKIVAAGLGWDKIGFPPVFSGRRLREVVLSYRPDGEASA